METGGTAINSCVKLHVILTEIKLNSKKLHRRKKWCVCPICEFVWFVWLWKWWCLCWLRKVGGWVKGMVFLLV